MTLNKKRCAIVLLCFVLSMVTSIGTALAYNTNPVTASPWTTTTNAATARAGLSVYSIAQVDSLLSTNGGGVVGSNVATVASLRYVTNFSNYGTNAILVVSGVTECDGTNRATGLNHTYRPLANDVWIPLPGSTSMSTDIEWNDDGQGGRWEFWDGQNNEYFAIRTNSPIDSIPTNDWRYAIPDPEGATTVNGTFRAGELVDCLNGRFTYYASGTNVPSSVATNGGPLSLDSLVSGNSSNELFKVTIGSGLMLTNLELRTIDQPFSLLSVGDSMCETNVNPVVYPCRWNTWAKRFIDDAEFSDVNFISKAQGGSYLHEDVTNWNAKYSEYVSFASKSNLFATVILKGVNDIDHPEIGLGLASAKQDIVNLVNLFNTNFPGCAIYVCTYPMFRAAGSDLDLYNIFLRTNSSSGLYTLIDLATNAISQFQCGDNLHPDNDGQLVMEQMITDAVPMNRRVLLSGGVGTNVMTKSFAASNIIALNFFGNGSGLSGIHPEVIPGVNINTNGGAVNLNASLTNLNNITTASSLEPSFSSDARRNLVLNSSSKFNNTSEANIVVESGSTVSLNNSDGNLIQSSVNIGLTNSAGNIVSTSGNNKLQGADGNILLGGGGATLDNSIGIGMFGVEDPYTFTYSEGVLVLGKGYTGATAQGFTNEYSTLIADNIRNYSGGTNSLTIYGPALITDGLVVNGSVKEGDPNNVASGEYSHVEGAGYSGENYYTNMALGYASHAEGMGNLASNTASHAEGVTTVASGNASHAEGVNTRAEGSASHASGENTVASGDRSFAAGWNAYATNDQSFVWSSSESPQGSDSNGTFTVNATASRFYGGPISGDGSGLTSLDASQLTSGTVSYDRLPAVQPASQNLTNWSSQDPSTYTNGVANLIVTATNALRQYVQTGSANLTNWSAQDTSTYTNGVAAQIVTATNTLRSYVQTGSANLTNWSAQDTSTYTNGVANLIVVATNALRQYVQTGSANLTNWSAQDPSTYTNGVANLIVTATNMLRSYVQTGSANLTNWSAQDTSTYSNGIVAKTVAATNALRQYVQTGSQNLTNWSAQDSSTYTNGVANLIVTATNALRQYVQTGSANLTNWSAQDPSTYLYVNNALVTNNLTASNLIATNYLYANSALITNGLTVNSCFTITGYTNHNATDFFTITNTGDFLNGDYYIYTNGLYWRADGGAYVGYIASESKWVISEDVGYPFVSNFTSFNFSVTYYNTNYSSTQIPTNNWRIGPQSSLTPQGGLLPDGSITFSNGARITTTASFTTSDAITANTITANGFNVVNDLTAKNLRGTNYLYVNNALVTNNLTASNLIATNYLYVNNALVTNDLTASNLIATNYLFANNVTVTSTVSASTISGTTINGATLRGTTYLYTQDALVTNGLTVNTLKTTSGIVSNDVSFYATSGGALKGKIRTDVASQNMMVEDSTANNYTVDLGKRELYGNWVAKSGGGATIGTLSNFSSIQATNFYGNFTRNLTMASLSSMSAPSNGIGGAFGFTNYVINATWTPITNWPWASATNVGPMSAVGNFGTFTGNAGTNIGKIWITNAPGWYNVSFGATVFISGAQQGCTLGVITSWQNSSVTNQLFNGSLYGPVYSLDPMVYPGLQCMAWNQSTAAAAWASASTSGLLYIPTGTNWIGLAIYDENTSRITFALRRLNFSVVQLF